MRRYLVSAAVALALCLTWSVALATNPPPRLYALKARLLGATAPTPTAGLAVTLTVTATPLPAGGVTALAGGVTALPPGPGPLASPTPREERRSVGPPGAPLELLSGSDCGNAPTGDAVTFEGKVRNVSDQPLRGVVMVINYAERNGSLIASASLPLEPEELAPGEVRTVSHLERSDRPMARCTIEFHDAFGLPLAHRVEL